MPRITTTTVSQRREQIIASWREFAPEATFANLTLAQFEVESQKALDVRSRMAALQTQLKGLMIERDLADEAQAALFVSVSNSIRGNPEFGLNSPLYRSLGFVPKMERKRPKRANQKETAAPPVDSPAGADAV